MPTRTCCRRSLAFHLPHRDINKYIAYTTIAALLYCLIVDPETTYVILHAKTTGGECETTTCKRTDDVITLPLLEISLPVSGMYK